MFNGMFMIYLNFMAFLMTGLCISQFHGLFMIYLNFMACFKGLFIIYLNFMECFNGISKYISISWHVYDLSQFYGMF
jgi:hypothetical protein